jgi:hypothetical protein
MDLNLDEPPQSEEEVDLQALEIPRSARKA